MKRFIANIQVAIDGCIENDRSCQFWLYDHLHAYAAKICYRYVKGINETDEVINDSFIKLFKNIGLFQKPVLIEDWEPCLKAWFKTIIINTCIDNLRKQQRALNTSDITNDTLDFVVDVTETPLQHMSYNEIIELVRQLSPMYRTVFNLYVVEGYTHEAIAQELQINIGTSKSNLNKARANLRKMIMNKNLIVKYA